MRYHFWQFLINQEGQPINEANVSVYLAGTETPITVYTGETTTNTISSAPQLTTSSNGYFEFWIGDEEEPIGYTRGTKIKIAWSRSGISSGMVDNIEVFQTLDGVDETDPDSTYKNKLISNALAFRFNSHATHDVVEDGFPIHGLTRVDVESTNNVYNKVVSDRLAYEWENHKLYDFNTIIIPEELVNSAHGLQPVQYSSSDSVFNKLISNNVLLELHNAISFFNSHTETAAATAWVLNGGTGNYEYNVMHNLDWTYPSVVCWDIDTDTLFTPLAVYRESDDEIRIENATAKNLNISVSRR